MLTLPETKLQMPVPLDSTNNMQHYISSILDTGTNKTVIIFTDGSAQSNSGPTGSGVIIKKQGRNSTPIKIAKAVKYMGSSYEGELEAIKIATEYARDNISPSNDSLHIFSDCQSAISAVTSQNRENYHNSTIRAIRENLIDISPKVQNIRISMLPSPSRCSTYKVKETPVHFLLNCKEYDTERAKLEKDIKEIFYKNNCHKLNITIDDLLGECDLPSQDTIIVRKKWKSLFW